MTRKCKQSELSYIVFDNYRIWWNPLRCCKPNWNITPPNDWFCQIKIKNVTMNLTGLQLNKLWGFEFTTSLVNSIFFSWFRYKYEKHSELLMQFAEARTVQGHCKNKRFTVQPLQSYIMLGESKGCRFWEVVAQEWLN